MLVVNYNGLMDGFLGQASTHAKEMRETPDRVPWWKLQPKLRKDKSENLFQKEIIQHKEA